MEPLISTQILESRRVTPVEIALIGQGSFQASPEAIPSLRKAPDPSGSISVHPSLLRHADEQTVVGLAAVFQAIHESSLDPQGFGGWSILAAPRYFGRAAFERAFPTFQGEGAWGVSPHLIPAHSLHSASGTISQALVAHGPNLGVGGTPGGDLEALLFASTLIEAGSTAGVWVVLTGRETERDGLTPAGEYQALALALTRMTPGRSTARLQVAPGLVRGIGLAEAPGLAISRWLSPETLRLDAGHSEGAIPRPHSRPIRGEI